MKNFGEKDGGGDELQFVADGSKKSRRREAPVPPEFRQDDQAEAESHTVLPSVPFGVEMAGDPNNDERTYPCTYEGCGKSFYYKGSVKEHIKSVHLGKRRYTCPYEGCNKSFSRKEYLEKHIDNFH
ncbi:uncharacterized protein BT62DRAFT_1060285 [Guyanagaster necrorhizus]|uniref:C2H2-type domain-containing protein n=1 Tax=Guyanagaster necrorhizus TaxID=856835 RepID=A0A9P7VFJ9_9AGAR|nr:uncharacterized protein BT62DRAFT_1060285 [Guyanagaster necrorhizus MCA 3950]KAG7439241.1 hypothetical protein BT62DRAFT_1060285 [Guyanagaster necrorhizus MCA 3950]